jgi:hypothetical protein
MAFILRDARGLITGLFSVRQQEGQEELPEDHPEVVEFRSKHPIHPEMLRPMTEAERKRFRELQARLDAEHVRIRNATLAFQRGFIELETALTCLLHAILDGKKSQIAHAIYHSTPGFHGRLIMVGNALEQLIREIKEIANLRNIWKTFDKHCRTVRDVRNTIAHGTPLTLNGKHARLTSPPFDVLKVGWPVSNGSTPGYSADDLEKHLKALPVLCGCADEINRYIYAHRSGESLPEKYHALEACLTPLGSLCPDAQKKPKQKRQPQSSPASRRKQAMARRAKS